VGVSKSSQDLLRGGRGRTAPSSHRSSSSRQPEDEQLLGRSSSDERFKGRRRRGQQQWEDESRDDDDVPSPPQQRRGWRKPPPSNHCASPLSSLYSSAIGLDALLDVPPLVPSPSPNRSDVHHRQRKKKNYPHVVDRVFVSEEEEEEDSYEDESFEGLEEEEPDTPESSGASSPPLSMEMTPEEKISLMHSTKKKTNKPIYRRQQRWQQ
jgi:hypothetical protein